VSAGTTARSTLAAVHGDRVRALQHVLYRAAKADPKRRFHALRDKVYREDVLWRAWVAVRRNNGAPGIDKTTLADVEEYGVTRLLGELADELRAGTWRPLPGLTTATRPSPMFLLVTRASKDHGHHPGTGRGSTPCKASGFGLRAVTCVAAG
jgi:hypothetical protein